MQQITFILPPPNVTGSLHLGHALNITIQDIMARFYQSKGMKINWIPGTDHAGIATQLVATRELPPNTPLNKEFIWSIKSKYENAIKTQLAKMHTLLDWEQYAFTLDSVRAQHVQEAFIELFNKGLIFRDKRFVYWDCGLETACSDLEVDFKPVKGKFYYIRYKLVDDVDICANEKMIQGADQAVSGNEYANACSGAKKHVHNNVNHNMHSKDNVHVNQVSSIVVATTRPETVFADCAVAVNPNDPVNKHLIGKKAIIPLVNRVIPIIGDDKVEIGKGTGVLKITPCHDLLDAEIAHRHKLQNANLSVIDKKGLLNFSGLKEDISSFKHLEGLSIAQARLQLETMLDIEKIDTIEHSVPIGEKSQNTLELMQTEQWFVDMKEMAKHALEAVENKIIELIPVDFTHIYKKWLENIQPWCISRQIIWGHQIPVWYDDDGTPIVDQKLAKEKGYKQETDVLDTWFSSALWAFSAQGANYQLPTEFLVTGKDILFFWVARMIMITLGLKKQIPFKKVFLHGLVLDEKGKKMSKVVGNVIDPLEIIEQWGVDVLRMALVAKAYPGKDIRFNTQQLELKRNLLTKIHNSIKFAQSFKMNKDNEGQISTGDQRDAYNKNNTLEIDPWCHWMAWRGKMAYESVVHLMQNWQFAQALLLIEQYIREDICAWFLEASKVLDNKTNLASCLNNALAVALKMLKPFAPEFVEKNEIFVLDEGFFDCYDEKQVQNVQELQKQITDARMLHKLSENIQFSAKNDQFLSKFTRFSFVPLTKGFVQYNSIYFKFTQKDKIITLLEKQILEHEKLIEIAKNRLNNEQFIKNASSDLVDEMLERIKNNEQLLLNKKTLLLQLCS